MNIRLLAAFAALVALLTFVAPVAASDADTSATVNVDCDNNVVRITFESDEADEVTYMILAGDTPVVDKTTIDFDDGVAIAEVALLDSGEYVLVFDPEDVIDNSFVEVPFAVDCPEPTPTPTPPPSNPPTTPPTDPPHQTMPPTDTVDQLAKGDTSPFDNPVFWLGMTLIVIAIVGFAMEARRRRRS